MGLSVVPITLAVANDFIDQLHRHHKNLQTHKFSIGCVKDEVLVGVAIVQRPCAHQRDDGQSAEVARLCTDGTRNACSILYAACARAAKAMGFWRIGTYILESEPGTSLKAAGWKYSHTTDANAIGWMRPGNNRKGRTIYAPIQNKHHYELQFTDGLLEYKLPDIFNQLHDTNNPTLFKSEVFTHLDVEDYKAVKAPKKQAELKPSC